MRKLKKAVVLSVLMLLALVICYPIWFAITGAFSSQWELEENLSPLFSNGTEMVKWSLLPQAPTLQSLVEVLLDSPGFFPMFWNSVAIAAGILLGQLLLDGLNTSIANIMISAAAMTTVSISNQVPTVISNLMGTIAGVFNPQMTIAYAKNDKKQLLDIISSADRIMIFIISIPIAFMTVFGKSFFELWVGETQDAGALYILALLNVGTLFVSASIQVLYHVFLITKRVKLNSVVILVSGALTVATVFVLLEITNLGMYAIVGASMVYGILRNLIFTPLYAARCLEVKWHTFYGDIVLGLVSIGVICLVAAPFELLIEINSWIRLFGVGIAAGILALLVNFFVVLRKTEREMVLGMVKKKLSRNRGM